MYNGVIPDLSHPICSAGTPRPCSQVLPVTRAPHAEWVRLQATDTQTHTNVMTLASDLDFLLLFGLKFLSWVLLHFSSWSNSFHQLPGWSLVPIHEYSSYLPLDSLRQTMLYQHLSFLTALPNCSKYLLFTTCCWYHPHEHTPAHASICSLDPCLDYILDPKLIPSCYWQKPSFSTWQRQKGKI